MPEAVTQIEGWRMAQDKLPSWATQEDILYPARLAMEQCSSEVTARYKASLVEHSFSTKQEKNHLLRLTDLTGGLGVDCAFMSTVFDEVTYVERNPSLCAVASANFETLGLSQIHPLCGDGTEVLRTLPRQDWIVVDPARRGASGRKVVALSDCEPDVVALEPLLLEKADHVLVKCSPMLDISLACEQLHSVREVHVVAVSNECKELLLVLGKDGPSCGMGEDQIVSCLEKCNDAAAGRETRKITCVQLPNGEPFVFTWKEERNSVCTYGSVEHYLYEPGASLLKAGCFRLPAVRFGLKKLHPNTHLYTSEDFVNGFPGRVFEVTSVGGFGKKNLKMLTCGMKKANITVRNFPESVEEVRHRLRLMDGGEDYLFATTAERDEHLLICCRKVRK